MTFKIVLDVEAMYTAKDKYEHDTDHLYITIEQVIKNETI